jgi:hypothetical protein
MATSSNEQSQPSGPHPSDSCALSQNTTSADGTSPRSTKGQSMLLLPLFDSQALAISFSLFSENAIQLST